MIKLSRLPARLAVMASFGTLLVAASTVNAQSAPTQLASVTASSSASAAPLLGTAATFAVLGGPAVTCTRSVFTGDVGVASTTAFTNTGCTIAGIIHAGDSVAARGYRDLVAAYAALAAKPCAGPALTGSLANITLQPGTYCFDAAATVAGTLTLNGPADGTWIFQIGTSGTGALTGTGFTVVMAGGAQPCNVYWLVAEGVTMTDSHLLGTVLAGSGISLTRGSFTGRALSKAAVTATDTRAGGTCL